MRTPTDTEGRGEGGGEGGGVWGNLAKLVPPKLIRITEKLGACERYGGIICSYNQALIHF